MRAAALAALALAAGVAAIAGEPQAMDRPLTEEPGNPARGRTVLRDRDRATCLICHEAPIPDEPDQGRIGPSLAGVGSRLTPGEIRLRLVDPEAVTPGSIMPSYYRTEGLHRVLAAHAGQPIYTAQQVEDVVAYLAGLK
jgi:sulfur-oxidizing protein SoxX